MTTSPTIDKLAAALAKAQGEFPNVPKDAANPFFKSKYADLAGIVETARPILKKYDLSISQLPGFDVDKGCIVLTTILLHASGEFLSQDLNMPVLNVKAQEIGSALTYARRYALQSVLCLAAEDDDGNAASGRSEGKPEPPVTHPKKPAQSAAKSVTINGKIHDPKESDAGVWFKIGDHAPVFARRNTETQQLPDIKGLAAGVEAELEVQERKNQKGGKFYEFIRTVAIVPPVEDNQEINDADLPF